jgi:hypothetical protein
MAEAERELGRPGAVRQRPPARGQQHSRDERVDETSPNELTEVMVSSYRQQVQEGRASNQQR